jgi:hypothetical protein
VSVSDRTMNLATRGGWPTAKLPDGTIFAYHDVSEGDWVGLAPEDFFFRCFGPHLRGIILGDVWHLTDLQREERLRALGWIEGRGGSYLCPDCARKR